MHLLLLLGLSGLALARSPPILEQPELKPGADLGILSDFENDVVQARCGKSFRKKKAGSNFYIINGKNLTQQEMAKEAPWVVSIHYIPENETARNPMTCTGVLISRRHVLTAAHCQKYITKRNCDTETLRHDAVFEQREVARYRIRTGSICGHKDCSETEGKTYQLKKIIYPASWTNGHDPFWADYCPLYNNDTEDIAIYELTEDVVGAQYACLATKAIKYKPLANYGYGLAYESENERHFLKKQEVKYIDCKGWGDKLPNGVDCTHFSSLISEPNASLACAGDSGGPVIAELNDRAYSVAVLSSGASCDYAKERLSGPTKWITRGDILVSVPYYLNWICKWSGVCPPQADATKDRRPTNIWHRNDGQKDSDY